MISHIVPGRRSEARIIVTDNRDELSEENVILTD